MHDDPLFPPELSQIEPQPEPQEQTGLNSVDQIENFAKLSKMMEKKAFNTKNIPALKRAYREHMKEAAKIKRLLRKIGIRVTAAVDSSSDEEDEVWNLHHQWTLTVAAQTDGVN